jgi:ABC-type uncharacterized transport system permease subunit
MASAGGVVGLLILAWGWHLMALLERGFTLQRCPVTNLFEAVLFVTWLVGGGCVVAAMRDEWRKAGMCGVMALTVVGLLGLHPVLDGPGGAGEWEGAAVSLHVTLVLLAYAAFAVSAFAGLGWIWLGWGKEGEGEGVREGGWPCRGHFERVMTLTLVVGVILLAAGLGLSFGLVRERYGVWWMTDLKTGWSLSVLAVYGGMAGWRLSHRSEVGWVAWGVVIGGVFVGLTFWGTNLLSRIHQP